MHDTDYEDPELEELKAEARHERQLRAHPDPRDPEYPGDSEEEETT